MITLEHAYIATGLMFAAFSVLSLRDPLNPTRFRSALFWGLIALSMLFGSWLGGLGNGLLVIALVVIGASGKLGVGKPATTTSEQRQASAVRWKNALFVPALMVPLVAVGGTLLAKHTPAGAWLISPVQTTLISLGLGCVVALVAAQMTINSSCRRARVSASSAPKGSSMSSTLGSMASARAMPTRCFMPPEISPGYLCMACARPTSSSVRKVRALSSTLLSRSEKTRSTAR